MVSCNCFRASSTLQGGRERIEKRRENTRRRQQRRGEGKTLRLRNPRVALLINHYYRLVILDFFMDRRHTHATSAFYWMEETALYVTSVYSSVSNYIAITVS